MNPLKQWPSTHKSQLLTLIFLVQGCAGNLNNYAQQKLESLPITLTALEADITLTRGLKVRATCTVENVNTTWIDIKHIDYCLWVNGTQIHCDKFPKPGDTIRVTAKDTLTIKEVTSPTPDAVAKLTAALAAHPTRAPHAIIKGKASIASPLGPLKFPFTSKPLAIDIQKLRLRVGI